MKALHLATSFSTDIWRLFYEDHSVNKLQNGIILLIFNIWKIRDIDLVHNLILSTIYEFCYSDVTFASFVNDKYGNVTVESIPEGTAFCYFYFRVKGLFPNAIHSEIRPVYGDKCFTRPAIHVWCKKFACVRERIMPFCNLFVEWPLYFIFLLNRGA